MAPLRAPCGGPRLRGGGDAHYLNSASPAHDDHDDDPYPASKQVGRCSKILTMSGVKVMTVGPLDRPRVRRNQPFNVVINRI